MVTLNLLLPPFLFTKLPKNRPLTRPVRSYLLLLLPGATTAQQNARRAPPAVSWFLRAMTGTRRARLVPTLLFSIARFHKITGATRHPSPSLAKAFWRPWFDRLDRLAMHISKTCFT
jgi:hypothetical protein